MAEPLSSAELKEIRTRFHGLFVQRDRQYIDAHLPADLLPRLVATIDYWLSTASQQRVIIQERNATIAELETQHRELLLTAQHKIGQTRLTGEQ